jgi:hypothetical protein
MHARNLEGRRATPRRLRVVQLGQQRRKPLLANGGKRLSHGKVFVNNEGFRI